MRTGQRDNNIIKDNSGLSLVELVIVIAIMAVLTGGSVTIVAGISNARVKSCAQSIYTDLNRVKTNTMAKEKGTGSSDYYFGLYRSGDDVILKEMINGDATLKTIAGKDVSVQYAATEGGTKTTLGSAEITCKFKRSSGGVLSSDFAEIFVFNNLHTWKVTVYKATGKTKLEQVN